MAISILESTVGETRYLAAGGVLIRATVGLFVHGLFGFGRPARIDRATGRVRRV